MTPHTQRLKLSTTAILAQPLTLAFWRGVPLRIQVAVFDHLDTAVMTGVDALVIMVKRDRSDLDSAALMSLTQATLTGCTAGQWIAKTHQHAVFEFTAAECNIDLQGSTKGVFHVVFKAVLSDGSELILGIGQAVCYEANAGAVGDPPTNPEPALSLPLADLRYAPLSHEQGISTIPGLATQLAAKASTAALTSGLATKADATATATALATKADATATATALATKANSSAMTTALAAKADLVGGVIPTSQIPALAIATFLTLSGGGVPASQAQMLTLRGQPGDWTYRSDIGSGYWIVANNGATLTDWQIVAQPGSSNLISVNGQTGVVVLGKSDIGLANVTNVDTTVRANHTGTQAIGTVTGLQATLDSKASKINGALPISEMGGGGRARVSYLTISAHTDPGAAEVPEVAEQTASPAPVGYIYITVGMNTTVDLVTYDTGLSGIRFTFAYTDPADGTVWVDTASGDLAMIRSMFQSALNDNSGGGGYTSFNDDDYTFTVTANGVGSTSMLTLGSQGFTVTGGGVGNDYIAAQATVPAIPPSGGVLTASLAPGKQISIVAASCIYSNNIAVGCVFSSADDIVFGGGPSSVAMQRYPAKLGQLYEDVVLAFASDPGYNPYLSITVEVHYLEF